MVCVSTRLHLAHARRGGGTEGGRDTVSHPGSWVSSSGCCVPLAGRGGAGSRAASRLKRSALLASPLRWPQPPPERACVSIRPPKTQASGLSLAEARRGALRAIRAQDCKFLETADPVLLPSEGAKTPPPEALICRS